MNDLWVPLPPDFDPVGLRDVHGHLIVEVSPGRVSFYETTDCSISELRLTTADADTRDRLLRWLARRSGAPVGCGAPSWSLKGWDYPDERGPQRWATLGDSDDPFPLPPDHDDTDEAMLPDGSFVNEARSLAEVVRTFVRPRLMVVA